MKTFNDVVDDVVVYFTTVKSPLLTDLENLVNNVRSGAITKQTFEGSLNSLKRVNEKAFVYNSDKYMPINCVCDEIRITNIDENDLYKHVNIEVDIRCTDDEIFVKPSDYAEGNG